MPAVAFQGISYDDANLKWIGVPLLSVFVVHLGMEDPLWPSLQQGLYYENLLISLLIAYLIFFNIKKLILYFDDFAPWEKIDTAQRWIKQLTISVLITSFWLLVDDIHDFFIVPGDPLLDRTLLILDLPVSLLLTAGINYYYYALYREELAVQRSYSIDSSTAEIPGRLLLKTFNGYQKIWIDHIAYLYLEDKITYVVDQNGSKTIVDHTMSSIENELSLAATNYFRINRKILVHKENIKSYTSLSDHRLKIELSPEPDFPCLVSKNKAAAFKQWFHRLT